MSKGQQLQQLEKQGQVPFPKKNADAIFDQLELHDQFLEDASDNKMTMKPKSFTEDHEWDEWAKTFKECLSDAPCLHHLQG